MRLIDADALYREYQNVVCHDIACAECKVVDKDTGECRVDYLISDAPTIEPKQEWTPCSKRLPEDGRYLCDYGDCIDFGRITNGEWYVSGVVAWMPLPTRYRGE